MDDTFLIVGLGNPGREYGATRHNIGFIALDYVADKYNIIFSNKSKFKADLAQGIIEGFTKDKNKFSVKVILCKPLTFMNLSGESVSKVMAYYKVPVQRLIVLHDEIDIDFVKIKTKLSGSSAGHNGIRSIDKCLSDTNYYRIRLGVGRPSNKNINISDYVLGNFTDSEWHHMKDILTEADQQLLKILTQEV